MKDLERIRIVTAHYRSLQGLRMLPWWLWMLALTAVNPLVGLPQGRLDYQLLIFLPGLVIAWLLSRLIGNYYERAFGRVEGLPSHDRTGGWVRGLLFALLVYVGFVIDTLRWLPVSVLALILAGAFFTLWWQSDRILTHHLVTAVLFAGFALLPLFVVPPDRHWYDFWGDFTLSIVTSVILIINSVLGHITLVRNLKILSEGGA